MKDSSKTIIIISLLVAAIVAAMLIWRAGQRSSGDGYKGQGGKGIWDTLFNNAANIVDASGRMTASTNTSLGNAISSIVATAKSGKASYAPYGYSDKTQDYSPYIIGGALVLASVLLLAVIQSNK